MPNLPTRWAGARARRASRRARGQLRRTHTSGTSGACSEAVPRPAQFKCLMPQAMSELSRIGVFEDSEFAPNCPWE
eukprot:12678222-Alexandrium_andersonii.AAC.1